jgi:hypothetical protein
MGFQLFEKFAEMIDRLPAKAVVNAVQLEKEMLENDLAQKRTLPVAEVRSIVAFCDFVQRGPEAIPGLKVSVPIQHLGFYRKTMKRLVEGGVLPSEAGDIFERVFSALLKAAQGSGSFGI